MADDEKQQQSEDREDWLQSPFTQRVLDHMRRLADVEFQHLLAKCWETTDPNIAAAFQRWRTTKETAEALSKGQVL